MNMISLNTPVQGFISGVKNKELDVITGNYFGKAVSEYTSYPKIVECIENKGPCLYIDLGPSGTSATFVKYNLAPSSKSKTFQIMTQFGRELEQLKKLVELTQID